MSDLEDALLDIRAVKSQIARTTTFRGYGPAAVIATAGVAVATASIQPLLVPDPAHDIVAYVVLWGAAAALNVAIVGIEALRRARRVHSGLADEMIRAAGEQLLPAVAAGALLTLVLVRGVPEAHWMLPGLWQILFSLGLFASCRSLPAPMYAIAAWYLGSGLILISSGPSGASLSPFAMALPFAVGQAGGALLLKFASRGDADG